MATNPHHKCVTSERKSDLCFYNYSYNIWACFPHNAIDAGQLGWLPGVWVGMETPCCRPRFQWGGQDMVGEQIINTGTEKQQKVCCSLKPYGSARGWDPSWITTTDFTPFQPQGDSKEIWKAPFRSGGCRGNCLQKCDIIQWLCVVYIHNGSSGLRARHDEGTSVCLKRN